MRPKEVRSPTWKGFWFAGALALGLMGAVGGCGDDGPSGPEVPPAPTVSGYDVTSAAPGDTIEVSGSNFSATPSGNQIRFANPLAATVPYAASSTRLRVVVPGDAATGPVTVMVAGQTAAGPVLEIARGVGEVWVFGGLGTAMPLKLPHPSPGVEYLLVPHAIGTSIPFTQDNAYSIANERTTAVPAPEGDSRGGTMTAQERFDQYLREELQRSSDIFARSQLAAAGRGAGLFEPAQLDTFRSFYVLNTTSGSTLNPASYTQVSAMLRYAGQHCLIYCDVDTLSGGNLSQADFNAFGDRYDNGIHLTNTTYFGTESDVDDNDRVFILVSPVVNRLTPAGSTSFIGGFFLSIDLYSPGGVIPAGTTNETEIFYVLAADPNGHWGNKFSTAFVAQENVKTIAHEYQHLISISFRLLTYGIAYLQGTWLEEGMSHMAEDLNGINGSNVGRANLYLADPGNVSLENDAAPLEQRGGIYLFMRYLGDRFGNGIYKSLLQSRCVGRPCIEAITGEYFYDTVGDFLATLYLSGKDITSDERYRFTSIDLEQFAAVRVTSLTVGEAMAAGTVKRTAGDFFLFTNDATPVSTFTLSADAKAGVRTLVVRTQ